MTEQEWLACSKPDEMLRFLRRPYRTSDKRKARLFICAMCRIHWDRIPDQNARHAVEVAEGFADGKCSPSERDFARDALRVGPNRWPPWHHPNLMAYKAAEGSRVLWDAAESVAARFVSLFIQSRVGTERKERQIEERIKLCFLLRDIFDNPFRPVAVDPVWLMPKVLNLAQQFYDDRAFDRLTSLADALEDAGCDNGDILAHCRGPGPHVRGCWALDLILGKE